MIKSVVAGSLLGLSLASAALAGSTQPPYAASPSVRLAEVATRARFPQNFTAVNNQFMSGSRHIARDNLTSISVCFANFYIYSNVSGEAATGGTATITGSVEYPIGGAGFSQLKFSGSSSASVSSGGYVCSDPVTVAIPSGAAFRVREWYSNPSGIPYTQFAAIGATVPNYDTMQFATSGIADLTMGGALTQTGQLSANFPIAILGNTARSTICIFGDSRATGAWDIRNDLSGDGGEAERAIGAKYAYINFSTSGDTINTTLANTALRVSFANAYCSHAIDELGINDLAASRTAAQVEADRSTLAGRLSIPIFGTTLTPESTSATPITSLTESGTTATAALASTAFLSVGETIVIAGATPSGYNGSWTVASLPSSTTVTFTTTSSGLATATVKGTLSDQFSSLAGQQTRNLNAQRLLFNTAETSGLTNEAGSIDVAHVVDPADTGLYPVNGSPNYYTQDGIHENTPAGVLIKNSAIWDRVDFGRR